MTPRINGPLLWSLAAIGVVLVAIVVSLPGVVGAAFLPGADAKSALFEETVALQDAYIEAEETYVDRFNGRSAFFEPKQPRRPVKPRATPKRDPPKTTTPRREPPKPKTAPPYSGPKLSALHGDHAFFIDGTLLRIGEEKDGLKLLGVEAPWIARVEHNGWEYERSLFERSNDTEFFARATGNPLPEDEDEDKGEDVEDEPAKAEPVEIGAAEAAERKTRTQADRLRAADRDAEAPERADEGTGEGADPLASLNVPEPLTDAQIDAMTKSDIKSHLAKLEPVRTALRSLEGDEAAAVRARVDREWDALVTAMQEREE